MAESLLLPPEARRTILAHCQAAAPAEGCGLLATSGMSVVAVYPTGNDATSDDAFVVPPEEHYRALRHAESRGWALGGSFHSHPRRGAVPSQRDIEGALDPDWFYLIISLDGEPRIRAWRIRSGTVSEVELT